MQKKTNPVNGWLLLIVFILTQLIYATMLFYTLPELNKFVPTLPPFDLRPLGYTPDQAFTYLVELGVLGREFYLTRQIPIDLLYPGMAAISFAMLWHWLLYKVNLSHQFFKSFSYLPIIGSIADYFENGFVALMLVWFPKTPNFIVHMSSFFTILKSTFLGIYLLALIILLIYFALKKKEITATDGSQDTPEYIDDGEDYSLDKYYDDYEPEIETGTEEITPANPEDDAQPDRSAN